MTQRAFRMRILPGMAEEYKRRHDELWPELGQALSEAGIYDYSIFLDEGTLDLFAVLRLRPGDTSAELPGKAVMKRWWDYMADLMEVEPGNRPKEWGLTPVFHFE